MTLTNGVSFSAANGSICSILLSYPLTKYEYNNKTAGVTLNIQSTGAYPLKSARQTGETSAYSLYNSTTKYKATYGTEHYPGLRNNCILFIFMDQAYRFVPEGLFDMYSDYSD